MKIKNIGISNKSIQIEPFELDFDKYNLIKIEGENGSGKTSIIEKILFDKYEFSYSDEKEFSHNRGNIFSYVPQRIIDNRLFVKDYISKYNMNYNQKALEDWLNRFFLDTSILNLKFCDLSGGEKKKIQIISSILKNTKYIILDEPTNNLDNNSTLVLKDILASLALDHKIILVTHDSRMDLEFDVIYRIDHHKLLKEEIATKESKCEFDGIPFRMNKSLVYGKLLFNRISVLSMFIIVFLVTFLTFFSYYSYLSEKTTSIPDEPNNYVFVSYGDEYDSFNDVYIKSEKIEINEENRYRYMNLNDISSLMNTGFVEDIYFLDSFYMNDIEQKFYNNLLLDELNVLSIPNIYLKYYAFSKIDIGNNLPHILPKDNKKEVVVSKNILMKYYGYTEENYQDALNSFIEISNHEYKIVDLWDVDILLISYSDDSNFGVYHLDADSFMDFGNRIIAYQQSQNITLGKIDEILIKTNDERLLVNHIFENYSANSIISNYRTTVWIREYNQKIYLKYLLFDIISSVILSIIVFLINLKTIKYNNSFIYEFESYYLSKYKIKLGYIFIPMVLYLLIFVFLFLLSLFLSFSSICISYLSLSFVIVLLPLFISYIGVFRRTR